VHTPDAFTFKTSAFYPHGEIASSTKNDFSIKHNEQLGLLNGEAVCFLWGWKPNSNISFKRIRLFEEFEQKTNSNVATFSRLQSFGMFRKVGSMD